jgi:uncharacterized protein (TIGR00725 family)
MNIAPEDRITISISGAADVTHCGPSVIHRALDVGRACAKAGVQLATGATSGFPQYVAQGFKEEGGSKVFSFGLSPAAGKKEHLEIYCLPLENMDAVIYTGFGFPGRDLMLVRSSDAIIIGCGRIGTIHEFTVAWESDMPIGILEGEWPTDGVIHNIINNSNRVNPLVVFDSDAERLVTRVVELVQKQRLQLENEMMISKLKVKA